jgi:hypothetical protein
LPGCHKPVRIHAPSKLDSMDAVESGRIEDARRILGLLAEPARLRDVAAVVLGYTTTDESLALRDLAAKRSAALSRVWRPAASWFRNMVFAEST